EPPESIAPHFVNWLADVSTTLQAAGMTDQLNRWNESIGRYRICGADSSINVQLKSSKALLSAIIAGIEGKGTKAFDANLLAEQFDVIQIKDAYKEHRELAEDLTDSDHTTWSDHFNHYFEFCENDPVMSVTTTDLRDNPQVDADKWAKDFEASGT